MPTDRTSQSGGPGGGTAKSRGGKYRCKDFWTGELEWEQNDEDLQKTTKSLRCYLDHKNGLREVNFDNWPEKLTMQLFPESWLASGPYFSNSKLVFFGSHPDDVKSLQALNNAMVTGLSGYVDIPGDGDIKTLILRQVLDVNGKKDYMGFIPDDQVGCLEKILIFNQLIKAVLSGLTEETSRLVAEGVNVNVQYSHGDTPLMVAASKGHCGVAR